MLDLKYEKAGIGNTNKLDADAVKISNKCRLIQVNNEETDVSKTVRFKTDSMEEFSLPIKAGQSLTLPLEPFHEIELEVSDNGNVNYTWLVFSLMS